jgi:hypothetical protein
MRNSKAGRILICMLFSTATFGVISGAALADDVATIYGRSSESGAMGESVNSAVPEDVSNAYGRAPEAELTADEPRYQLTFTLMQGVHRDDLPAVDVWPGRAAAPLDEDATWKITTQSVDKSASPHG